MAAPHVELSWRLGKALRHYRRFPREVHDRAHKAYWRRPLGGHPGGIWWADLNRSLEQALRRRLGRKFPTPSPLTWRMIQSRLEGLAMDARDINIESVNTEELEELGMRGRGRVMAPGGPARLRLAVASLARFRADLEGCAR